jgi:mannose-1-phosphate guanylyltransferase
VLEAILLVGGQGTRLRPLTNSTPKPMLPVAGFPCTEHQIARAKEAGVTRIVLGTSYRAEVFEQYFGHGEKFGIEIIYATEESPLGTGGAIRNAAKYLNADSEDPIIIFNGDILTGLDIPGLASKWRDAKADVAIYLTTVEDPRAYGLVPTDEVGNVLAFLEKPTKPEEIVTNQINAGCYIFKKSVIDQIPVDEVVSVERETFPMLLSNKAKVIGIVDKGYWLDLGTPLAFAKGSADLVKGLAPSPLIGSAAGDSKIENSAAFDSTAKITGGTYVGHNAIIGKNSQLNGSVIFDGVVIDEDVVIENSIISSGVTIGHNTIIRDAVIAENAKIGFGNELINGVRVFPNSVISDTSVRFSSDKN